MRNDKASAIEESIISVLLDARDLNKNGNENRIGTSAIKISL
jgi:hypothetical protein